ncbi:MAG: CRISPR-associated RAMP protein Csx10 [Nodosilinea sp.]
MKQIQLLITAKSPLALGQAKTGSSVSNVEGYIPGTVIRGAIAGTMLRQQQAEGQDFSQASDSDFKTLFIDNQAIFQNAYPALTDQLHLNPDVRVLPATALSAKNSSGFKPKSNGAFDTLIDRFCAEAYGMVYDPNCPVDGGRVDAFKGFYSIDKKEHYHSHSTTTRLLTRVGINRRRNTAEDQVLYSTQVLNEFKRKGQSSQAMVFAGKIWVCDALGKSLCDYLHAQPEGFRMGGSTSRGLGKVWLTPKPLESKSTLIHRLNRFNQTLKERWQRWQIFGHSPQEAIAGRCFFTLNLQSDAILTENWLRTIVISEEMLQKAANLRSGDLKLHASYASSSQRSGWNAAWGLPKDGELTTDRGSVYLFSIDETAQENWVAKLEELEIWGIGNLTAEGFGQIKICDDFHNVLREQAV